MDDQSFNAGIDAALEILQNQLSGRASQQREDIALKLAIRLIESAKH